MYQVKVQHQSRNDQGDITYLRRKSVAGVLDTIKNAPLNSYTILEVHNVATDTRFSALQFWSLHTTGRTNV